MTEEKLDRIFKWIDLIKVVLYGIVAGAVALAAWATRIQIQTNENKLDIEASQASVQHYRDLRNEKETIQEHRLTAVETDIGWLKKGRG